MAEYTKEADWSIIPQHCRDGLKLYIERGIPLGSFLSQYAPFVAWGSPERYHSWIRKGGWIGVHDGGESCLD